MADKRFTFEIKTQGNKAYTQWYDNGKPINSAETLCELLNELVDENEQLRKEIEDLNWELSEIKKSEAENYNITDGLW